MIRRAVIALLLGTLVFPLLSVAQSKLPLEQAVTTALEKNPARKAVVFEQRASADDVHQTRATLLPRLGFGEEYQRGNDPIFVFGGKLRQQRFSISDFALNRLNTPTPFDNFSTRLSGAWLLFDSGANWLRLRQAKQMHAITGRKLERTDQELVMRVVEAYAGMLLAIKQQQVADDALKTSQSILDRSRANVEAGMVVESDLLSAQVNHAARLEDLIRARNAVALAQAQLNREMGASPDTAYELTELSTQSFPALDLADLEKRALEHRPDLQGVALQQSVQADGVRIAKAAFGPRMSAVADWGLDNPHFSGGGGNNWMAGVEVQLDLFDGGARRARLQHERAMKDRIDALHEDAVSGIRLEVRKAYLDFDAARQQVEVARAAVGQAQESLRIGQNRYESGLNTITDLLRMQEAAVRAQTDYFQSLYRVQASYARVELATGTLGIDSAVVKQ